MHFCEYKALTMKVAIIGGGIAGLTTAIALQQIGVTCTIYESAPDVKPLGAGIVLAANAMKALEKLNLSERVLAKGRLLNAFSILDQQGKIITKTNSPAVREKYGADNFAIHRADLHELLRSELTQANLRTNKQFTFFEKEEATIRLYFKDGSSEEVDYLLACDGIHSMVRKQLLPEANPRYAGYTCWRAVVNMPHLSLTEATETWGTEGRFGIVPLTAGRIYFFACLPAAANNPVTKNYQVADLLRHFHNFHSPVPDILHHTRNEQLIWNNICDLKPLKHFAFGNILLLGDAAHATTPNMGQGACQAIEDAVILATEWKQNTLVEHTFRNFEKKRLKRTSYITVQSRRIGQMAHVQNRYLAAIRNFCLRHTPDRLKEQSLKKLLDVEF